MFDREKILVLGYVRAESISVRVGLYGGGSFRKGKGVQVPIGVPGKRGLGSGSGGFWGGWFACG